MVVLLFRAYLIRKEITTQKKDIKLLLPLEVARPCAGHAPVRFANLSPFAHYYWFVWAADNHLLPACCSQIFIIEELHGKA